MVGEVIREIIQQLRVETAVLLPEFRQVGQLLVAHSGLVLPQRSQGGQDANARSRPHKQGVSDFFPLHSCPLRTGNR